MPQISKAWYNEPQFQLHACIYKFMKIYKKHMHLKRNLLEMCHFGYILCRIRSQYHFLLWGEEPRNNFGKIIVDLLLLGR